MSRILFAILVVFPAAVCPAATPLSWEEKPGSLALRQGEAIVWQFNFGRQLSKTHFHPLNLPGGKTLTWASPPDHPWHYGLWFSWKFINGVNYWEEDPQTGYSHGRTTLRSITVDRRPDFSARFELELQYHLPDHPPVLVEHRVIEVSPPTEDGGYSIDWNSTFVAKAEEVILDRTPVPSQSDSKAAGGYAGLSVRLAKEAAEFKATSSQPADSRQTSAEPPERMRFRAMSVDYSGSLAGTSGGITIEDDPENINSPSPWYIIRNTRAPMTFFSPAVIQLGPLTLARDDSFRLHYRIIIHSTEGAP